MTAGDLSFENDVCFYAYRGKGGKTGRRELPRPAWRRCEPHSRPSGRIWGNGALRVAVALSVRDQRGGAHEAHVLRSLSPLSLRRLVFRRRLHILRHTAAKLRRDAGESIEDVSRFLDHSSLAVTTTYLRRLEGQEDLSWRRVAEAIGL